ncbi:hypothetical protein CYY_006494 [Polysphondylium violaceum]|uniref:Uncharacterized protein n=1 Tax=Polysphondylium violaceum TaxID=133409 RepID=A0A8J4V335_9MYCE|nr:hypothetical protein CYY_006494 [Polysphondylium violaceum]
MVGSEDLRECLKTVLAVSDFIKTSLGPKSGDKLIVDEKGEIQVTNDGYTILSYLSKRSPSSLSSTLNNNDDFFNELFDKRQQQQQSSSQNKNDSDSKRKSNDNDNSNDKSFSSKSNLDRIKYQSIIELLMDCCKSQERSYGDGTTSVIVLTGALCSSALKLVFEKGIHPHIVVEAFQQSLNKALLHLDSFSLDVDMQHNNNTSNNNNSNNIVSTLQRVAESCLSSKSISFFKESLAKMCIDAVKSICKEIDTIDSLSIIYQQSLNDSNSNINNNNNNNKKLKIDLKNIKLHSIPGESIEKTRLVYGVLIKDKFFSHENMTKTMTNARVLVLSEALEIPKPKSNFSININSIHEYNRLFDIKNQYFKQIKEKLTSINPTLVVCQWAIDQEINEFLFANDINAISWVQGNDLENIALITNASIVYDLLDTPIDDIVLGEADIVKEITPINDSSVRYIEISNQRPTPIVSIIVRGGSQEMNQETLECLKDCLHIVKGCLMKPKVVPSGGVPELYLYNLFSTTNNSSNNIANQQQQQQQQNQFKLNYCMNSWASSLLSIPITLLENSGVDSYNLLKQLIDIHHKSNTASYYGVNIAYQNVFLDLDNNSNSDPPSQIVVDMRSISLDLLDLKKSILKLATETCILILGIDKCINIS